ncbi:hypothetical protein [Flammeovirga aprica]|uniref:Uncharacterized protein n=1 Tax=Flammeovirga aprica JL-4 TaxID=694437 RepID=A0A7X9S1Q7_9BACT|nr:hypothetical protein [Flammeovirga aprica]NME72769.1 hypothetical protein [Flammeovirga aprica JL-4]
MKKFLAIILGVLAFASCSSERKNETPAPQLQARDVNVSFIYELVKPMTVKDHEATDGAVLTGYRMVLKDQRQEFVVDSINIENFTHTFNGVYGKFTVTVMHPRVRTADVTFEYYLSGEQEGNSSEDRVSVNLTNNDYTYITVRSRADEVKGSKIENVVMRQVSTNNPHAFYAYVVSGKDLLMITETTRGDIPTKINGQVNKQHIYYVDFETKTLLNYSLGFDKVLTPEKIHPPVINIRHIKGTDNFTIGSNGEIIGKGRNNSRVTAWKEVAGNKKLKGYSFEIDVETKRKHSFMNVYVAKDRSSKNVRLSYYAEGTNKGKWGKPGAPNPVTTEEILREFGEYTVVHFFDEFNVGNFFWRSGSSNEYNEEFTIKKFNVTEGSERI